MLLRLFRSRRSQSQSPQSAPPEWEAAALQKGSRAMTPSRAQLKQHLEAIAALKATIDEYELHHHAAEKADAELRDAQAALEALADNEAAQYRSYVVGGAKGEPPEPLTALRAEAMQRLDQARSSAEQMLPRSQAVRPLSDDAHARLTALTEGTYSLAREALLEDAREIAEQMYRSFAKANAAEAALYGIRDAFMARRDGVSATAIDGMLAGGPWPSPHLRREGMRQNAEELRKAFAKALDQIEADPGASFELKPFSGQLSEKDWAA